MIKVVNVISDTNIGGAGKCVLTFLKYYHRKQFELVVVVPKNSLLIPEIEKLGGTYVTVDGIADCSMSREGIFALKEVFQRLRPDVVHAHGCMSARIAARLFTKAKIVYTRHSVFEPSKKISVGLGKLGNGIVNNTTADKIIAVAEAAKENLVQTGVSAKKITVIQNGVEPLDLYSAEKKAKEKARYGIGGNTFVLGIAARLNPVKGHVYILEALRKLVDDGFDVCLIIAGTGEAEEEIRRKTAELSLEKYVVMAGFLQDVCGLMNILDVNVNASYGTEATSLALLEGMSLGVPAVVSDFGGNPGVVTDGENGFLFRTCDSGDLYEKLKRVLSDDALRQRMCANSKSIFETKFRAETNTKAIETVYESLAKNGKKG